MHTYIHTYFYRTLSPLPRVCRTTNSAFNCIKENATVANVSQWMDRWLQPVEFAMMHQVMLFMALIPLTMSKRLLAIMSQSFMLSAFPVFPFADIVKYHIFLGYWFCGLLIVRSVMSFQNYFRKQHPTTYLLCVLCENLLMEFMCTDCQYYTCCSFWHNLFGRELGPEMR